MQEIKDGIYYEDSYLGVTLGALVFSYGTIFIDAPLRPEDARSWRSALLNQRGGVNRLLVSLDSHTDRTLGARVLDCSILAHQKSAQAFRNRPIVFKGETIETGADWETYVDSVGTRWASPDLTFSKEVTLHWGGDRGNRGASSRTSSGSELGNHPPCKGDFRRRCGTHQSTTISCQC